MPQIKRYSKQLPGPFMVTENQEKFIRYLSATRPDMSTAAVLRASVDALIKDTPRATLEKIWPDGVPSEIADLLEGQPA